MSRVIKFRAWDTHLKKMYEVVHPFGNLDNQDILDDTISFGYAEEWDEIYKLMQYTGLHDRNGVKIFEGDIVQSHHLKIPIKGEVIFSEFTAGFTVRWDKYISRYVLTDEKLLAEMRELYDGALNRHAQDESLRTGQTVAWEVIGNIYENPELLTTTA